MRTCKFVSGGMYRWLNTLIFAIAIFLTGVMPQFCYGRAGEEELMFSAEDIASWKSSIAAGQAELTDDGLALVSGAGGWGGGVSSPWLTVDFSKSPLLSQQKTSSLSPNHPSLRPYSHIIWSKYLNVLDAG